MPVEIRELVIKATVEARGSETRKTAPALDAKTRQALVAEAVEQALEAMRRKQER